MWIVKLALDRPYTFIILALLILIMAPVVILRTPTDIFPNINIPVVSVAWQYTGLDPEQMEGRLVAPYEKALTTLVDNIEHTESTSYNGVATIKIYLQPGASLDTANAQVTAASQYMLRQLPPGTLPPEIINFSASSVPIIQIGISGQGLNEQQLNDYAQNFIRPALVTIPGAVIPQVYGGKQAQITVSMDQEKMQSKGVSPGDVLTAMQNGSVVLPSGTAKIGPLEYDVRSNAAPRTIPELDMLPIKQVNGAMVYLRDVATVSDGAAFQTNIVRQDGRRGVLISILKGGSASTLSVVSGIRGLLPRVSQLVPPAVKMTPIADQSVFVRSAVQGVIREAIIAAALTGLMILLFLGSWRSTVIIAVSIPLSILTSVIVLSMIGETINTMTLGGLALAVGILVDDATVTIENIERFLENGYEMREAILDGAAQIAVPALVSTLCICIVFLPMFFLTGVSKYLFAPLAEAVIFAMIASYILSRTLVPTLAMYLLRHKHTGPTRNPFTLFQRGFERQFEKVRSGYETLLTRLVFLRKAFIPVFLLCCCCAFLLLPFLGRDFFPSTDSGEFILHMRGRTGLRIEETARLADQVEDAIHKTIPANEVNNILDNIGLPYSPMNTMHMTNGGIGAADADILVSLNEDHHPTADYIRRLRESLPRDFPGTTFYFLPADITTQILNFGLPAPIDIQIQSSDLESSTKVATAMMEKLRQVPGLVDLRIQQPLDYPTLDVDVDRTKAGQGGYTARDVAQSMLNSLSGSFQITPMFFLNYKNGVNYNLVAQTPQYRMDSLQDLQNIPINSANGGPARPTPETLNDLSGIHRGHEDAVVSEYNIRRVVDIYGAVQDRDLGAVGKQVQAIVDEQSKTVPRGMFLSLRGQVNTMRSSYISLLGGLVFSILLVYMLIVVNFQSWLDPFIIITALPAALAGIVLFLFFTHTTLSVPALMGAIMCMGVATANSILVVSFAKMRLAEHHDPILAAIESGATRFRPVCMTALAMIIGMVPMALGLGDGGEQNAPLGRAVIGGLMCATVATLIFVPAVFALLHGREKGSAPAEEKHNALHPQHA
ncbi:efflux RND transporter permease subunit [Silvibacterium dinghuense]|uniref:Efflux RND transporter permease subunit n=1 Tax=Silvibacterium dinghuense TaxID=1560006 RepID=A0A4Q1S9Z1_9BACT|nr:efflux RND transporter permease subunit [Silvibacterium dinghuense]RXS93759.1 efflux RND transporter permease subunit [Silvibacterium dinghuense]GGH07388.1 RND transporter [Silvibacterium dinghuense]